MTRRHTFRVEMYAAIPYTVEVEAECRHTAMSMAENDLPIPPEEMHLPALYAHALSCELIPKQRRGRGKG
jgi:hypothetical protein